MHLRVTPAMMLLVVLFVPCAKCHAAQDVSAEGMQKLHGSFSSVVQPLGNALAIDGNPWKPAWQVVSALRMKYVKPSIPGFTKKKCTAKIAADTKSLYLLFRLQGGSGGKEAKSDSDAIINDAHAGAILKLGKTFILLACNGRGSFYHAKGNGEEWDASWNPGDFEAKAVRAQGYWNIEMRVALADLKQAAGELPAIWGANFIVKRRKGKDPDNHYAWKPGLKLIERKVSDNELGILYFSGGKIAAGQKSKLVEASKAAAEEAAANAQQARKANATPPRGFAFSRNELTQTYPDSPVMFVPLVEKPPTIDGDPTDSVWEQSKALNGETQLAFLDSAIPGHPDVHRTLVRVVSDKDNLYTLFVCEESNPKALVTNSSALWADDICDVLIDVGRSLGLATGHYHIIEVNAAGKTALHRGTGRDWAPKSFQIKTKVMKDRWIVETRIGFKDLDVDTGTFPAIWGANFMRYRAAERGSLKSATVHNTEFAWRGSLLASPHVPARMGVLCLQAGNAYPQELLDVAKKRGVDLAKAGLRLYTPAREKPGALPVAREKKAEFADPPAVSINGKKAVITFTVTDPVDAAVDIVNEKGEVVRHLAAGMLGKRAPTPFQPGLKQKLEWTFDDDLGKPVPKAKYNARVQLGLKASFGKVLIGDPHRISVVRGIAVDKDGLLLVLSEDKTYGHYHVYNIQAFDREGKFVRHVMPFPSRLPYEKVAGAAPIRLGEKWMPIMYKPLLHSYVPQLGVLGNQKPAITRSGRLILHNAITEVLMVLSGRLLKLGTDGSVEKDYLGPLTGRDLYGGMPSMAISPDDKYVYLTGLRGRSRWGGDAHHAIYRFELNKATTPLHDGRPAPFIGSVDVPGSGKTNLTDPRCVAVDGKGNVLIADTGNNRIVAFKPDGSYLAELPVDAPVQLDVHPATGAIYAITRSGSVELQKFKSINDPKPVAKMTITLGRRARAMLCVDRSSDPAAVYFVEHGNQVQMAIDKGSTFEVVKSVIGRHISAPNRSLPTNAMDTFELGHDGKTVHLSAIGSYGHVKSSAAFDVRTGERVKGDRFYKLGPDGMLYAKNVRKGYAIERFKPDLTPAPFAKTKVIKAQGAHGFAVDKKGNVYVPMKGKQTVIKYGPDGTVVDKAFIAIPMPAKSGTVVPPIAIDRDGAVYLVACLKDPKNWLPSLFRGRLPYPRDVGVSPGPPLGYRHYYASLIKFSAKGGNVKKTPGGNLIVGVNYGGEPNAVAEGVEWFHFGVSPISYRRTHQARCTCEFAQFGQDGYDRFFLPDALRYSVEVVDKNANVLLRFGQYGNLDARGPGSPEGEPDIGFTWPVCVRATDDACIVADKVSRRIVRIELKYLASKKVAVEAK